MPHYALSEGFFFNTNTKVVIAAAITTAQIITTVITNVLSFLLSFSLGFAAEAVVVGVVASSVSVGAVLSVAYHEIYAFYLFELWKCFSEELTTDRSDYITYAQNSHSITFF